MNFVFNFRTNTKTNELLTLRKHTEHQLQRISNDKARCFTWKNSFETFPSLLIELNRMERLMKAWSTFRSGNMKFVVFFFFWRVNKRVSLFTSSQPSSPPPSSSSPPALTSIKSGALNLPCGPCLRLAMCMYVRINVYKVHVRAFCSLSFGLTIQ